MVVLASVLAFLLFCGVFLSRTAGRIDRLHRRVETAAAALDAQLVRRAGAALAMADRTSQTAPEAAALIAVAARAAQGAEGLGTEREILENALSRALRSALAAPAVASAPLAPAAPVDAELAAAARRVELARNFYNDAVRSTLTLRGRWVPRVAHLAGRAPLPVFFEIDDTAALEEPRGFAYPQTKIEEFGELPGAHR